MFRPVDFSYVSPAFAAVSSGYLSTKAQALPRLRDRLPKPISLREAAIYDAILWGCQNPAAWDAELAPLKLKKRFFLD